MKKGFILLSVLLSTFCLLNAQTADTNCTAAKMEVNDNSTMLTVYPNPSTGTFQIIYTSITSCPPAGWGGVLMINIMNSNGVTVYNETVFDFDGEYDRTVDLSGEPKGEYIIEVVSGRQKKVKRQVLE